MGKLAQQRRIALRREEGRGGLSVHKFAREMGCQKRECAKLIRMGRKKTGMWKLV